MARDAEPTFASGTIKPHGSTTFEGPAPNDADKLRVDLHLDGWRRALRSSSPEASAVEVELRDRIDRMTITRVRLRTYELLPRPRPGVDLERPMPGIARLHFHDLPVRKGDLVVVEILNGDDVPLNVEIAVRG